MKGKPGRPKSKPPDGQTFGRPGQTFAANQAPRQGQRTQSPLKRFLSGQKTTYSQQAPSYAIGRTRRMA